VSRPYTREDAVQWCTVQTPQARASGAGLARAVTRLVRSDLGLAT